MTEAARGVAGGWWLAVPDGLPLGGPPEAPAILGSKIASDGFSAIRSLIIMRLRAYQNLPHLRRNSMH